MTRVKQISRILQKGDLLITVLLQRSRGLLWINLLNFHMMNSLMPLTTSAHPTRLAEVVLHLFTMESYEARKMVSRRYMQSTKEFLAELKVLAHVHHLNLVNSLIILVYYLFLLDYITSLAPAQFRLFIILQSF